MPPDWSYISVFFHTKSTHHRLYSVIHQIQITCTMTSLEYNQYFSNSNPGEFKSLILAGLLTYSIFPTPFPSPEVETVD